MFSMSIAYCNAYAQNFLRTLQFMFDIEGVPHSKLLREIDLLSTIPQRYMAKNPKRVGCIGCEVYGKC